jgi:integrase
VSNAAINRELQILKHIFSVAVRSQLLRDKPYIEMLRESPPRTGFFDDDQIAAVMKHLPETVEPVVEFAWRTGWRIASEVLTLEWRQVDFNTGEVRLDPGMTKNREGRVIKMTSEVRALLERRRQASAAMKEKGIIVRWVFCRVVSKGRRGTASYKGEEVRPITTFDKAWKAACRLAGCPGRIPHDLRRTAVRNFIRAGIPQVVAKRLTGHKTDAVFHRYNIVSEGDLVDAAQRMSGRHVINS